MLAQGTGREQDDGDMRGGDVILDTLTELQTVHHRHHHVAHNQVGHNLIGQLKTLLPVFGFVHLVAVLQDAAQQGTDVGIVVNDEDIAFRTVIFYWRCWQHGCGGGHHRVLMTCGQDVETACSLYVEHLVDELYQLVGVAAQHIIESLGLRTGLLAFFCLCQLLQRCLNQGQRGAQLMAHLGIEVKFLTLHPVALVIEAGGL